MKIRMHCVVIYDDDYEKDLVIPDDMKFAEIYRYTRNDGLFEAQRFYAAIYNNDQFIKETLSNQLDGRVIVYDFGEKIIVEMRQCAPVNEDLPLISKDELNNQYKDYIQQHYVKATRESHNYRNISDQIIDASLFDYKKLTTKDLSKETISKIQKLSSVLTTVQKDYIEYIAHPLEITNEGQDIALKCGVVYFKSWLSENCDINRIEILNVPLRNLLHEDYYHGQKIIISKDIKDEFQNRVNEICNML